MVTGSKGIHVVAPIQRRQSFPEARELARGVAEVLVAREGELVTSEWIKDKRSGRILVDVRATRGMSVVAPYSSGRGRTRPWPRRSTGRSSPTAGWRRGAGRCSAS